jgi:hypothetical protein
MLLAISKTYCPFDNFTNLAAYWLHYFLEARDSIVPPHWYYWKFLVCSVHIHGDARVCIRYHRYVSVSVSMSMSVFVPESILLYPGKFVIFATCIAPLRAYIQIFSLNLLQNIYSRNQVDACLKNVKYCLPSHL